MTSVTGSNPVFFAVVVVVAFVLFCFFFSCLTFTTALVVFITAKIAFIFISKPTVHIHDFHVFTIIYSSLHGFITHQHNDQLPVSLLAQLVEHCTDVAEFICSNPIQKMA